VIEHLTVVEKKAQSILNNKENLLQLSKRKDQLRLSVRSVGDCRRQSLWMSFGPMMIKCDKAKANQILANDEKAVSQEMTRLREGMQRKYNKLQQLECSEENQWLKLKALSKDEANAVERMQRAFY